MRRARWRRPLAIVAVILLALGAVAGAVAVTGAGRMDALTSYSLVGDGHSVRLEVTGGAATWTRVVQLTQTPDEVAVTVRSFTFPFLPQTAVGQRLELLVDLREPMGDRRLWDGFWFVPRNAE